MDISTFFSCLGAWAHLQSCENVEKSRAAIRVRPAADVVVAREEKEAPYYTRPRFSGFYLGASAGYGRVNSDQYLDRGNNHGAADVSPGGFVGSITAGYNFNIAEALVLGVEGDIGLAAISDDEKSVMDAHSWKPSFGPFWGTVRGRVGWTIMDSFLLYGTAGVAFMQTDNWTLGNNANESSWDAKMRTGWTVGVGAEYAIDEHWSAKAEYLYMDFGKHHGYTEDDDPYWFDDKAHIFRLGVNYRF